MMKTHGLTIKIRTKTSKIACNWSSWARHILELVSWHADALESFFRTPEVKRRYLLEISVETLEAALAAQRGGADRIELCGNLNIGGVTPSIELMRAVRAQLRIPIFGMIRPHGGKFVYSEAEFADMKRSIGEAKQAGMDGLVAGVLTSDGSVDMERTRELVALARPLPLTVHRAFDDCGDLRGALEDVIPT